MLALLDRHPRLCGRIARPVQGYQPPEPLNGQEHTARHHEHHIAPTIVGSRQASHRRSRNHLLRGTATRRLGQDKRTCTGGPEKSRSAKKNRAETIAPEDRTQNPHGTTTRRSNDRTRAPTEASRTPNEASRQRHRAARRPKVPVVLVVVVVVGSSSSRVVVLVALVLVVVGVVLAVDVVVIVVALVPADPLPLPGPRAHNQSRYWPVPGRVLASTWPGTGQYLASTGYWPVPGQDRQVLASAWPRYWPVPGQVLASTYLGTGQYLPKYRPAPT